MSGPPLPPRVKSVVVDEELILSAVREEAKRDASDGKEDGGETKVYDMPTLPELTVLRLSFKNIYQIDNLVDLSSLVELRLDNNTINEVANIGHLVNLKWLDLSFNNIKAISGLDNLTALTDLSFFNNAITTINGLDALVNLNVLSLGNNKIATTDQIQYLRRFEHLEVVQMEGNPVCDELNYKTVALAYLPHLKYLDYKLVVEDDVRRAREACQDELMELEDNEALEAAARQRDEARAAHMKTLAAANLSVTDNLFEAMLKADSDLAKFKFMPGVAELLEEYEEMVKTVSTECQAAGLETQKQLETEQSGFKRAYKSTCTSVDKKAIRLVVQYRKQAKRAFLALHNSEYPAPNMLDDLKRDLDTLRTTLLQLESECVEQLLDVTDTFDSAYRDIKTKSLALQQTYFRAVEDAESSFSDGVTSIAEQWVKQAQDGNLDGVSDELAALAADRDSLFGYLSSSHDSRVDKLLGSEDETRERTNSRYLNALQAARQQSRKRNRDRVVEIQNLYEQSMRSIHDSLEEMFGDDDD